MMIAGCASQPDGGAVPPKRPDRAPSTRPSAAALPDVVASLIEPLARDARDPLRRIRLAWNRICGMPLGRHIEPLRLEGNTLHIGAHGAIWRDAVFHQRATLLGRIRQHAAHVDRIWLHTLDAPARPADPPPAPAPLTPRTDGISDPGLRQAVERLLAARRPPAPDEH